MQLPDARGAERPSGPERRPAVDYRFVQRGPFARSLCAILLASYETFRSITEL